MSNVDLRETLVQRYLKCCDARVVESSRAVVQWLTRGLLDEPSIIDTTSLSLSHKKNATTGTVVETDPIEPFLDVFQLIPVKRLTLEGTALLPSQLSKLFHLLLSENCRSRWTLATVVLHGNQVDASVFPMLLQVVDASPLLTLVRVDPSPNCRMYELEQACAANDAKCRHLSTHKKISTFKSAIQTSTPLHGVVAARHTDESVPAVQVWDAQIALTSASHKAEAHMTASDHCSFSVSVTGFFSAIKSWMFFFYGPQKPLPDAMFYFILVHTIDAIRSSMNHSELMDELKSMEKRFVQWREGNFVLSSRQQPTANVPLERTTSCAHHCANCDSSTADVFNTYDDVGISKTEPIISSAGRHLFESLLKESESGSSCFVKDQSEYLLSVFELLLDRCVAQGDSDGGRRANRTELGSAEFNFLQPPAFCKENRNRCIKQFCRSIFCTAAGYTHGIKKLSSFNSPLAQQLRQDALSSSKPTLLPFEAFLPIGVPTPDLVAVYNRHEQYQRSKDDVPSTFICQSTCTTYSGPISALFALASMMEDRVAGFQVSRVDLNSSPLGHLMNAYGRLPTQGSADLQEIFTALPRSGVPLTLKNEHQSNEPSIAHFLFPTVSVQFVSPGNHPDRAQPFDLIRTYFLLHRASLNGSGVILGVKLRPEVFEAHRSRISVTHTEAAPLIVSEVVGNVYKHGVPVALHVTGVCRVGEVWYLQSKYGGVPLLLHETSVNRGADRYGAFAFADCSIGDWLQGVRRKYPMAISNIAFPLDTIELSVYVELALVFMLHEKMFYRSTEAFSHRQCVSLDENAHRAAFKIVTGALAEHQVGADANILTDTIEQLISWYRCGTMGKITTYWKTAPVSFRDACVTAARRLYGANVLSRHTSLFPLVSSSLSVAAGGHGRADDGVAFIAQNVNVLLSSSGRLVPRVATPTDCGEELNLLPFGYSCDTHYLTSSAEHSVHRKKRFLQFEFPRRYGIRVTAFQIFFQCGRIDPSQTGPATQSGFSFEVAWSDDGSVFTTCSPCTEMMIPQDNDSSKSHVHDIYFGNVGAHPFWVVYVSAVNAKSAAIVADHAIFPVFSSVQCLYLSSALPAPLLVEYDATVLICATPTAEVIARPHVDAGIRRLSSKKHSSPIAVTHAAGISLYASPGGFLSGAFALLGGEVDCVIAIDNVLHARRDQLTVDLDRFSGQVISTVSLVQDHHRLWGQLPQALQLRTTGGFQTGESGSLLFVYNETHFCVFSLKTLTVIIPLSVWRLLPGRQLREVDGGGIATKTSLQSGEAQLTSFPFAEVTHCIPLREPSCESSQRLLISLLDQCVLWDISSFSAASMTVPESDLGKEEISFSSSQSSSPRTHSLNSFFPQLVQRVDVTSAFRNALRLAVSGIGHAFVESLFPVRPFTIFAAANGDSHGGENLSEVSMLSLLNLDSAAAPFVSSAHLTLTFPVPTQLAVVQILVDCLGSTTELWINSYGYRRRVSSAPHDADGVATLANNDSSKSTVWEIQVVGQPSRIKKIACFATSALTSPCLPVVESFVRKHRGVLQLNSAGRSVVKCSGELSSVSPVICGVSLSWIRTIVENYSSSLEFSIYECASSGNKIGSALAVKRVSCRDLSFAHDIILMFTPKPLQYIVVEVACDSTASGVVEAEVEILEVPLKIVRVVFDKKNDTIAPVHLRMTAEKFVDELLTSESNRRTAIPRDSCSDNDIVLRKEAQEYTLEIHNPSQRCRLCRVTAEVVRETSAFGWEGQPVSLQYQSLDGRWISCATTCVSSVGLIDFFWANVLLDPAPVLWRISFLHEKMKLRNVVACVYDHVKIVAARGYQLATNQSTGEPINSLEVMLSPKPTSLPPTSLLYVGTRTCDQNAPVIRLDVPSCLPPIGGLRIITTDTELKSDALPCITLSATLCSSGERILLWRGIASECSCWVPCRCSELIIEGFTFGISGIELLGPTAPACHSLTSAGGSLRFVLVSGTTEVVLPQFPACIPLALGTSLIVTGSEHATPLLFASVQITASLAARFQIEQYDSSLEAYEVMSHVDTIAQHSVECHFKSYTGMPTKWRITCLHIDPVPGFVESQVQFADMSVSFSWLSTLQQLAPLNLAVQPCTLATNAIARHNSTSQAVLRHGALVRLHSCNDNVQPYLRLGIFDTDLGGSSVDWEKRSQVSSASAASAGSSLAPFVFIAVDLHMDPQDFGAIAINAEADNMFELTVQWSDDSTRFETVAIHRQGDGWHHSAWSSSGAHRHWRVVASFSHMANRKAKRGQSQAMGFGELDEKNLAQFAISMTNCAVRNLVWYPTHQFVSNVASIPLDDTVALRRGQAFDKRNVPKLNPLLVCAVPVSLRPPAVRTVACEFVDHELGVAQLALWRISQGKPALASQRAAAAAEDLLQQQLPSVSNPQQCLDKESAQRVRETFFENKDFDLNDASLTGQTNRVTNDPSIVVRGSTLTGVRGIPPGTKVAVVFEWHNTSLIPAQPNLEVSALMTMERRWLGLQSEFSAFDAFCRAVPALRTHVFLDLEMYTAVYATTKRPLLNYGGNFPSLPMPALLATQATPDCVIRSGVTVFSKPISLESLQHVFSCSALLCSAMPVISAFFRGTATVVFHTSFAHNSLVKLEIVADPVAHIGTSVSLKIQSLKLIVTFDSQCGSVVVELVGAIEAPMYFGLTSFFAHSIVCVPTNCASSKQTLHVQFGLVCNDDLEATRTLFGDGAMVALRNTVGTTSVKISVNSDNRAVVVDHVSFHSLLWFSNIWQVPCAIVPSPGDTNGLVLIHSLHRFMVTRSQVISFLESCCSSSASSDRYSASLSTLDNFYGEIKTTAKPGESCKIRFKGTVSHECTSNVSCVMEIRACALRASSIIRIETAYDSSQTSSCVSLSLQRIGFSCGKVVVSVQDNGVASLSQSFTQWAVVSSIRLVSLSAFSNDACQLSASTLKYDVCLGDQAVRITVYVPQHSSMGILWDGLQELTFAVERTMRRCDPNLFVTISDLRPLLKLPLVLWVVEGSAAGIPFKLYVRATFGCLIDSLTSAIAEVSASRRICHE